MNPLDPRIAGGGDRHIAWELRLALDRDNPNRRKPRMVYSYEQNRVLMEETADATL